VFLRILTVRSWIVVGVFIITSAFLLANLLLAFRALTRRELVVVTTQGPRVVELDPQRLRSLVVALGVIGALVLSLYAGSHWDTWLLYWNSAPFGRNDPVLGHDAAFYVFSLPFYDRLRSLALLTLIPTLIAVTVMYISAGAMSLSPRSGLGRRGGGFFI